VIIKLTYRSDTALLELFVMEANVHGLDDLTHLPVQEPLIAHEIMLRHHDDMGQRLVLPLQNVARGTRSAIPPYYVLYQRAWIIEASEK